MWSWVETSCLDKGIRHFGFREKVTGDGFLHSACSWTKCFCCSSKCSLAKRPRSYYTSAELMCDQDVDLSLCSNGHILDIHTATEHQDTCLASPWQWLAGMLDFANFALRLPCFTRGIPSHKVTKHACLTSLPAPLLHRWSSDCFPCSVGAHSDEHLLSDGVRQRVLCAAEKEALLGFPRSHICKCNQDNQAC